MYNKAIHTNKEGPMQYEKIQSKKIYEEIAEAIEKLIINGSLKPGDRLDSVEKLASNYAVSRSAIREALSALRAKGFLDIRQGEGTFVRHFDATQINFPITQAILMKKEDIQHLLEMRQIIEVGAAGSAAKHRTSADLTELQYSLDSMKKTLHATGFGEDQDLAFHAAVANASHNPLLITFLNQVSELMLETIRETRKLYLYTKKETMETLYEEHLKIYEAIVAQDVAGAQLAMQYHLNNVETLLDQAFH